MHLIGLVTKENALAEKSLLGKSCREYARAALAGAGATLMDALDTLASFSDGTALIVRGNAPGLTEETLRGLAEESSSSMRACVLMAHDMRTPLALALSGEALSALETPVSPLTLEDTLEQLDRMDLAPHVWFDTQTSDYYTVTDAISYAEAFRALNTRNIARLFDEGVIILDPARVVIEADVQIGEGTLVYPGNHLQGHTVIGRDCVLLPNNRMQNATVGDETTVESSVLLDCAVGSRTTVGPYAYLRPHTAVGNGCRVGDFVEVKNSAIGDGTKISHLTYVGDSDLGQDINLGCGVVFVNYNGKIKQRSTVADHAFIGCNCNLVAPVHIGENAYIAAGSTVTDDIPKDALYIARSRGTIKENWVQRRKEQGKL